MKQIFKNLCDFSNGSILRNGIAMFFANYFDLKEEKKKFQKYFSLLDKDRNGLISFEELVDALSFKVSFFPKNTNKKFSRTKSVIEISKIYKFAGWEPEKSVSFLEFFSANIDFKRSMTSEHIKFMFNSIDLNANQ